MTTIGNYVAQQLRRRGVKEVFGIPGDFAIPHFEAFEDSGINLIVNAHEPGAGYAADAYARLRGFGAALVTFGAGGLNMVNAVAQAYAERSPVLVISGAPEVRRRASLFGVHHQVKTLDSQCAVYREVTEKAVSLQTEHGAKREIDAVFETIERTKRPGYLEIPRDLVYAPLHDGRIRHPAPRLHSTRQTAVVLTEVERRLNQGVHSVIYAGVEVARYGLRKALIALVEKLNLPVVTSMDGKAVFPESHRNFAGIYMGRNGSQKARRLVEESDCLLRLGVTLTDVNTGGFTARFKPESLIVANADGVVLGDHLYPQVDLGQFIRYLLQDRKLCRHSWSGLKPTAALPEAGNDRLTTAAIVHELNGFLKPDRFVVVADVGDFLYAARDLKTDDFLAPAYYNSMGFAVPAALAASLAVPEKRTVALVGDGGFQMTGNELGTAAKYGLNPIIILFNNGSYRTLRAFAGNRKVFGLAPWNYCGLAKALGAEGVRVHRRRDFRRALSKAARLRRPFLIEAIIPPQDISPTWRRISAQVRSALARGRRD